MKEDVTIFARGCMAAAEPTISVVIPTFNRAGVLPTAIESALAQTISCEIVVVDHGSTDHTPEVVRGYGDRLRYIRREADAGPVFAWLDGVLHATGSYVHVNFDDDWIDPQFLERTAPLMADGCGFVMTDAAVHYPDGSQRRLYPRLFPCGINESVRAERYLLDMPRAVSPGCALFRREDMIDAFYTGRVPFASQFYHGAGPDLFVFLVAVLRHPRFAFVDEPLAHFRSHAGSITVHALADAERGQQLSAAYDAVKRYYLVLKWGQRLGAPGLLWRLSRLARRVRNRTLPLFRSR